jgi:hypothetical protein
MHKFPPIDREIEDAALQTLFFQDSEFEGRKCRLSVADYLAFLSMRGPKVRDEIAKLRTALAQPSPTHLERDIIALLRARNWRHHNLACVAIACSGASETLLLELWRCIQSGSWTSPQLAATAAFTDPAFYQKGLQLVEDHSTYYKSIVSLASLLNATQPEITLSELARANLSEAETIDQDHSGDIAVAWYQNLVEVLSEV